MWPQILLHPNILPRHAKVAISFCDIDSRDRFLPFFRRVLPIRVVAGGLLSSIGTAVKHWLHYTLVAGM